MRKWYLLFLLLMGLGSLQVHAQNLSVGQFPGSDVGIKINAAQNSCIPGMSCVITIGPELSTWPVGTWPTRCANCTWIDLTHPGSYTVTPTNVKVMNSRRFADQFPGVDIGASINAAFADCSNACTVFVPAGSYSFSTTINYPAVVGGQAGLVFDAGAVLTYTGTGDAIAAIPVVDNNAANVMIRGDGASLIGTSSAANGIHLKALNVARIENLEVRGFSGTGAAGILNEGANVVTVVGINTRQNYYGIREVGVCNFLGVGKNYAPNAFMMYGGHVQNNTKWGIFEDSTNASCAGINNSNEFFGVTAEGNGTNGNNTTGNVFFQQCVSCAWIGGYMEEPASLVVSDPFQLGDATHAASRTQIIGGILNSTGATDSIDLVNADNTFIAGVDETLTVTNFVNMGANTIRTVMDGTNWAPGATNFINTSAMPGGVLDFNSFVLNANNKLGSGANPRGQAEINTNGACPDALNANLSNGFNLTDGSNTGMSFGFCDSGLYGWIQARNNVGANNTAYPLKLNSLGSSVQTPPLVALGSTPTLSGTGACATITTKVGGSWSGKFTCTGTTGASTVTITPGLTATNGWSCGSSDITAGVAGAQSASTTTTCQVKYASVTANDVLTFTANAF